MTIKDLQDALRKQRENSNVTDATVIKVLCRSRSDIPGHMYYLADIGQVFKDDAPFANTGAIFIQPW